MAFVTIANACSLEIRTEIGGQRIANTLGFYKGSGISESDLQTLADFIATNFWAAMRPQLTSSCSLREVYARDMTSYGGPTATSVINAGQGGSYVTGSTLPFNVTWCVSFRTAQRGRANRGRNYWPAIRTGQWVASNNIATANANAIVAIYQRLLPGGASDPTPFRWVVLSRQIDGEVVGRAVPITAVLGLDTTLDSQRRRLPGRGL